MVMTEDGYDGTDSDNNDSNDGVKDEAKEMIMDCGDGGDNKSGGEQC